MIMSDTTQIAERNQGQVMKSQADRQRRGNPIVPAVDIYENERGIALVADLPGVDKSGLDVKVHDGNLYIEAETALTPPAGFTLHHSELHEPYYARAFTLSAELDTSRIEANLQNGVLRLVIPRREEARPRRIEING
jgi:HSP20 family molecular chaperone IbpA